MSDYARAFECLLARYGGARGIFTHPEFREKIGPACVQLLEKMRADGHGINLDISLVPLDKRDAHMLAYFEIDCAIAMKDESYRLSVCLHEAAHAHYDEEENGKTYVEFQPPLAWYEEEDDVLCHGYAGVVSAGTDEEDFKRGNLAFVKVKLSAGIAQEVMTRKPEGDETIHDEEDLEMVFDKYNVASKKRKRLREQARTEILKDLRSPKLRAQLWKRAHFYKRILENAMIQKGRHWTQKRKKAA